MKKFTLLVLVFSLLSVFAFAELNADEFNKVVNSKTDRIDELVNIGNEVHQKAQECHDALAAGDFKKAHKAAIDALNKNEDFKATARQYGFKISNILVNGKAPLNNNEIGNPMMYNNDLAEVVVLTEVMLGKMSLSEAIEDNPRMANQAGVLGFLSGNVKHMMADYVDLNEAFMHHPKCRQWLNEAYKDYWIVIPADKYCETAQ